FHAGVDLRPEENLLHGALQRRRQIPQSGGIVAAGSDNLLTVRAESDGPYASFVLERYADLLAGLCIPKPRSAVDTAGQEHLAVRTESQSPDFALMPHR